MDHPIPLKAPRGEKNPGWKLICLKDETTPPEKLTAGNVKKANRLENSKHLRLTTKVF